MNSLKENHSIDYTNQEKVELEIQNARKTFKKYQWPIVDVTRKSVEETAASIIKIYEIKRRMDRIILASQSEVRKKY